MDICPTHPTLPPFHLSTDAPPPKQTHAHVERRISNKWRQEVSEGPVWEQYCAARGLKTPTPPQKPLIRRACWVGAVVSVEEEVVAVSLGCYLLACFESPAASCTPSHSHWSCCDPPPMTALYRIPPPLFVVVCRRKGPVKRKREGVTGVWCVCVRFRWF